jgi:hypothetical protein
MAARPADDPDAARRLLARLRRGAAGDEHGTWTAADARLLADELGRLLQSNERLRRQNRRLRLRLQRAAGGTAAVGGAMGDSARDALEGAAGDAAGEDVP